MSVARCKQREHRPTGAQGRDDGRAESWYDSKTSSARRAMPSNSHKRGCHVYGTRNPFSTPPSRNSIPNRRCLESEQESFSNPAALVIAPFHPPAASPHSPALAYATRNQEVIAHAPRQDKAPFCGEAETLPAPAVARSWRCATRRRSRSLS